MPAQTPFLKQQLGIGISWDNYDYTSTTYVVQKKQETVLAPAEALIGPILD
jgi:hypothetical protein